MINKKPGRRGIRREIAGKLTADDWDVALSDIVEMPTQLALNELIGRVLHPDERIKWRAVTAVGALTAKLADEDMEAARVIVRRLMWNMTEESGNCAYGTPEAIGEILACHAQLATEFAPILISFIHPQGNFLEYEPLQTGALWGLGRLSQVNPELTRGAVPLLMPLLRSEDSGVRGTAVWVLGLVGEEAVLDELGRLRNDDGGVRLYIDGTVKALSVGEAVRRSIDLIAK